MMDIKKSVGERIRDLRKARGLSQEQLGERAGFHFSYIGGLERGERNISLVNLSKLSESLNVNINDFFRDIPSTEIDEGISLLHNEIDYFLKGLNEKELTMVKTILEAITKTYR
jgi:transcriptional regulator with XRE-family HTH domain